MAKRLAYIVIGVLSVGILVFGLFIMKNYYNNSMQYEQNAETETNKKVKKSNYNVLENTDTRMKINESGIIYPVNEEAATEENDMSSKPPKDTFTELEESNVIKLEGETEHSDEIITKEEGVVQDNTDSESNKAEEETIIRTMESSEALKTLAQTEPEVQQPVVQPTPEVPEEIVHSDVSVPMPSTGSGQESDEVMRAKLEAEGFSFGMEEMEESAGVLQIDPNAGDSVDTSGWVWH